MVFETLFLSIDGQVDARAVGHATEVLVEFHKVCSMLLGKKGAWRMTSVHGAEPSAENAHDSDMTWELHAQLKG